jgi:hypothetical protein
MSSPLPLLLAGQLDPFFETGTEGVIWSLLLPGVPGYDNWVPLADGDRLRIYGAQGTVAWEGPVHLEHQRRYRPYPMNPACGQQEVFGFWVHGFQADVDPEVWATAFFTGMPAVVAPRKAPKDHGPLAAFLDTVAQDAVAAWAVLQVTAPDLAKRLRQALPHTWAYVHREMHWPAPPLAPGEEGPALVRLIGLSRARRYARVMTWPTPDPQNDYPEAWARMRATFPHPWTAAEAQQWAQCALPHDTAPFATA